MTPTCSTTIAAYGGKGAVLCRPAHHALPFTGLSLAHVLFIGLVLIALGLIVAAASRP